MATPATTIRLQIVKGGIPSLGATYEDITRKGATTRRLRYIGQGSERSTVSGHRFALTQAAAKNMVDAFHAAKGKEVYLESILDSNWKYRVYIFDVTCQIPKRVEVSGSGLSNYKWRVDVEFSVMRTA